MENNWVDAQNGTAILFTPRNGQHGSNCNQCTVADITYRYNILRHTALGFTIAGEDGIQPPPSQPSQRIHIHDNLILDVSSSWSRGTGGAGILYIVGVGRPELLLPRDITIDHNTQFEDVAILVTVGGRSTISVPNFVFTNKIQPYGKYGIGGGGGGGMRAYFKNYKSRLTSSRHSLLSLPILRAISAQVSGQTCL